MNDYEYQSPSSTRYGSPGMRRIWSEFHKRRLWREVWFALAYAQSPAIVPDSALSDIVYHTRSVDIEAALAVEKSVRHDLLAELEVFRKQVGVSGAYLHLGATSSDIVDTADAMRVRDSLEYVLSTLRDLCLTLELRAQEWSGVVTLGWTHLQPAEPVSLGGRFEVFLSELSDCLHELSAYQVRCKGFKGAVGNYASYVRLYGGSLGAALEMERRACEQLDIVPELVSRQIASRARDVRLLGQLATLAAVLGKLALDIRLLCSYAIGDLTEEGATNRVGSTAMPHKVNPIAAENVCSLARMLPALWQVTWQDAADNALERTLDDSANRRYVLPEAFLITDAMLTTMNTLLNKLTVDPAKIRANLSQHVELVATAALLQEVTRNGGDANMARIAIRDSVAEWRKNPTGQILAEILAADERIGLGLEQVVATIHTYDLPAEVLQSAAKVVVGIGTARDG